MAEFSRVEFVEALRAVDGKWAVKDEEGNIVTWEHEDFMEKYSPTSGFICACCGNYIDAFKDLYYHMNELENIPEREALNFACEICGHKTGKCPVSVLGRKDYEV